MSPTTSSSKKRPGRPPGVPYFTAEELAELLDVPVARMQRALECPKLRAVTFPMARKGETGSWRIPVREARGLVGGELQRLYSLADFAELVGFSVPYIYELASVGVIKVRKVLGLKRVAADQYWQLPKERPQGMRSWPVSSIDGSEGSE